MFHEFDYLRKIYIYVYLAVGSVAVIMSLFDYCISEKLYNLRILFFGLLFILSFVSFFHWICIADLKEVQDISFYVLGSFSFVLVGFLFFFSRFPESYYHSYYIDYYFHSHLVWHTCINIALVLYYFMLYKYYYILEMKKPQLLKNSH